MEGSSLEDDLENTITNIEGKILHSEENEEEIEVGNIKVTYVDIVTARETGESLFDVFDHVDEQLYKYYEALHDKKNPLHKYLLKEKDWLLEEAYDNFFLLIMYGLMIYIEGKN